jgi:6-pyruvoyltetrahydropterin/6-carboxytetrahydropterin synthase
MRTQSERTHGNETAAATAAPSVAPADAPGEFRVAVTKDSFVFASAHFITYQGHKCETLHGHNYRVGVVLEGAIDPESWYVYDFVTLKRVMRRLCDEIDHRVLLPLHNPKLEIREEGEMVSVLYEGKPRYLFPRRDCALLPVPNTTVEMLARYLVTRLRTELDPEKASLLRVIEMEVEENFGQSAIYRERLEPEE